MRRLLAAISIVIFGLTITRALAAQAPVVKIGRADSIAMVRAAAEIHPSTEKRPKQVLFYGDSGYVTFALSQTRWIHYGLEKKKDGAWVVRSKSSIVEAPPADTVGASLAVRYSYPGNFPVEKASDTLATSPPRYVPFDTTMGRRPPGAKVDSNTVTIIRSQGLSSGLRVDTVRPETVRARPPAPLAIRPPVKQDTNSVTIIRGTEITGTKSIDNNDADSAAVVDVIRQTLAGRTHTIARVALRGDTANVDVRFDAKRGRLYGLLKKNGRWTTRPDYGLDVIYGPSGESDRIQVRKRDP